MDPGAYVLGRMKAVERDVFRRHLTTCAACREEVELLEAAANAVPLLASAPEEQAAGAVGVATGPRDRPWPGAGVRPRARETGQPRPGRRGGEARGLRGPVSRPVMLVFLAAVALTIGLSFVSSSGSNVYRAVVAWHPGGGVVKVDAGHGELLVTRMPAPPAGRVYEVWLRRADRVTRPAVLFDVPASGKAEIPIPGSLSGVASVIVTAEPSRGSRVPTGSAVLLARLD